MRTKMKKISLKKKELSSAYKLDSNEGESSAIALQVHRQKIKENITDAYYSEKERERLARTLVKYFRQSGFPRFAVNNPEGMKLSLKFVDFMFELQERKPFFYFDTTPVVVMCWNAKKKWGLDHIEYEWGHVNSIHQNGDAAHELQNLCLQSARCNQHIQSSLNIHELVIYGGEIEKVVRKRLEKREDFFKNDPRWKPFISELETAHEMMPAIKKRQRKIKAKSE